MSSQSSQSKNVDSSGSQPSTTDNNNNNTNNNNTNINNINNNSTTSTTASTSTSGNMRQQQRRGSVTSAALSNLFRSSSNAQAPAGFSGPVTAAAIHEQRRRLSISTLGLAGTSPTLPSSAFPRRGSLSTNNSESIDGDEDFFDSSARTAPVTPFSRRMSFGAPAMWNMRGPTGTSPGPSTEQGFIWSEQLKSRAENTVAAAATAAATGAQPRSSFSFPSVFGSSPPRISNGLNGGMPPQSAVIPHHDRARSVSDMPAPPAQVPRPRERRKPDHMQERILKGDFYMD